MILKGLITFSILFAISFSITHEFTFTLLDEEKCTVTQFVNELNAPTGVDDLCDIHHEYHEALMFPQTNISIQKLNKISELVLHHENYNFLINLNIVIPPIA